MYKIAVVGATGLVGQKMLEVLERKQIPFNELVLYSSPRSAGKSVEYQGKTYTVKALTEEEANQKFDFVLMSAGGATSERFSPIFESAGSIVIDNSSAFRMHEDIDLIVPEVNVPQLNRKIIANPNCSTIQSVVPLKPLQDKYGIKRVAYTTYQAVSGSGAAGINDLKNGSEGIAPTNYPHSIYNNALPHIDVFLENGYTKEEQKMIDETKKILGLQDVKVTATCVRIPVQDSHSVAINVTLDKDATVEEIKQLFENDDTIILIDNPQNNENPRAITATGTDHVYVGRIRRDDSLENSFHIWCTADNLLKGAALNAVQILEQIHRHQLNR